jgi:pimeloyl-ACP methyl ester carboxylesterase
VLEFVKKCDKINKDRVFLIGRSLGGSVALHLLADLKEPFFKGTVIESTFTSI